RAALGYLHVRDRGPRHGGHRGRGQVRRGRAPRPAVRARPARRRAAGPASVRAPGRCGGPAGRLAGDAPRPGLGAVQGRGDHRKLVRAGGLPREGAIKEGGFGPVDAAMTSRIGDVVAAPAGSLAIVATKAEPRESALTGMHGSLTPSEQLVPALMYTAA